MEMKMLLWLYAISASFSATTLLKQKGAADRRGLVTVLLVGGVSAIGVMVPSLEQPAFWVATVGFTLFMLAPGLLVRLGRKFAERGSFSAADRCLRVAVVLFPAAGFRAELDLYRILAANGGIHHPAAPEVRARIAALTGGPMHRAAPATLVLIVVILLAFAVIEIAGNSRSLLTLLEFGANHAPFVLAGEVHRLMTAIFLHSGWLHLIFNVSALWILGRWVEPDLGPARTLNVFFLSGLIGNIASLLLYRSEQVVGAGASGGAMGLIGCATVILLRPGGNPERTRRLPSLLLIIGATLFLGTVVDGIDNGAHVGGLVTGAVLGLVFTRVSPLPAKLMRMVATVFVVLAAVAVVRVGLDLPEWRRTVALDTPNFTMNHPAGAEVRVNEKCFELSWHLIGKASIELADSVENPEEWFVEQFTVLTDGQTASPVRLPRPRAGWWATAETEEGRFEVYLLEDPRNGRATLLSFLLADRDPIIHRRWVEPMIESFRFR